MGNTFSVYIIFKRKHEDDDWMEVWRYSENELQNAKDQLAFLKMNGFGEYTLINVSNGWQVLTDKEEATNGTQK